MKGHTFVKWEITEYRKKIYCLVIDSSDEIKDKSFQKKKKRLAQNII